MYATFAFAITMLGVFSIFENIKGNQKFSVLKYYMLLTIICFTTSSFFDFLNFSGHSIPYYKEISRIAGAILVLNMLFLIVQKLALKPSTVSTFKKKIFVKFQIESDVDLYKILRGS